MHPHYLFMIVATVATDEDLYALTRKSIDTNNLLAFFSA